MVLYIVKKWRRGYVIRVVISQFFLKEHAAQKKNNLPAYVIEHICTKSTCMSTVYVNKSELSNEILD